MSRDFKRKLPNFLKVSKNVELGRYYKVKFKSGNITYKDGLVRNEETAFNSLDLIIDNSNYSPEYLKSLYIIDYYRILRKVEQKIKNKK